MRNCIWFLWINLLSLFLILRKYWFFDLCSLTSLKVRSMFLADTQNSSILWFIVGWWSHAGESSFALPKCPHSVVISVSIKVQQLDSSLFRLKFIFSLTLLFFLKKIFLCSSLGFLLNFSEGKLSCSVKAACIVAAMYVHTDSLQLLQLKFHLMCTHKDWAPAPASLL